MAYLAVTLNHFRPIQAWARSTGAEATLNVATFELELKTRNRYYLLHPRFLVKQGHQFAHGAELSSDAVGFIGWLPYRPLRWELSTDKLKFKSLLRSLNEPTPESASQPAAIAGDFLLKRSIGSFGNDLAGPFRESQNVSSLTQQMAISGNPDATVFAEKFVAGTNVKVWFWGATPFHAHRDEYPTVHGDGVRSMLELVTERLLLAGMAIESRSVTQALSDTDRESMEFILAYQGLSWIDVPAAGRAVWLDYRYGRRYSQSGSTNFTDNALDTFSSTNRSRIAALGAHLASALKPQITIPVLYSVDAVLDSRGKLWWLEMNSNPALPPEGYQLILNSLFGLTPASGEQAVPSASSAISSGSPSPRGRALAA